MKKSILSLFVFGAVLSASPIPVSFVSANSSVGPYLLNVNGQQVQAMCMDDFLTVQGSWSANLTAVNGSNFSNTYLGNQTINVAGHSLTSGQVYEVEADLFSQLIKPNADRTDIQQAAWAIMDPNTMSEVLFSRNQTSANILRQTLSSFQSFNASGYEIVSQVNPDCNAEQEFIIQGAAAPEPASFALFGAGFVAFGLTRFARRKKQAGSTI